MHSHDGDGFMKGLREERSDVAESSVTMFHFWPQFR